MTNTYRRTKVFAKTDLAVMAFVWMWTRFEMLMEKEKHPSLMSALNDDLKWNRHHGMLLTVRRVLDHPAQLAIVRQHPALNDRHHALWKHLDWEGYYNIPPNLNAAWRKSEEVFTAITEIYKVFTAEVSEKPEPPKPRSRPGYVYLVKSPTGAYKIGRTKTPENRLKTFNIKLPFEVEFICLIQSDNMCVLEKQLHNRYKDKRVNGEWFMLTQEDIEQIKALGA